MGVSHKRHERGTTGDSQFKTQKGYTFKSEQRVGAMPLCLPEDTRGGERGDGRGETAPPNRPLVSESRIKRITQITRIIPHIPTAALSFPLRYVFRMPP